MWVRLPARSMSYFMSPHIVSDQRMHIGFLRMNRVSIPEDFCSGQYENCPPLSRVQRCRAVIRKAVEFPGTLFKLVGRDRFHWPLAVGAGSQYNCPYAIFLHQQLVDAGINCIGLGPLRSGVVVKVWRGPIQRLCIDLTVSPRGEDNKSATGNSAIVDIGTSLRVAPG